MEKVKITIRGRDRQQQHDSVVYLYEEVNDAHWRDNDQKHRRAVADNADRADDTQRADHPRVHAARQLRVDDVDVLREPVYDAADRRAVEEGHRCAQPALQDRSVQQCRRV